MTPSSSRIAAAAVLLLVWPAAARSAEFAAGGAAPALRTLIQPGETAPAFTLDDIDGRTVAVSPGGGKPSLVVFFSAFCPLCRELAPSVAGVAARSEGKVVVIGVNLDGKRFGGPVRSFVAAHGFRFPVLLDEIRDDLFVASDRYGVDKTPTAVLVDGRGRVAGSFAAERMRDLLKDFDRLVDGVPRN